LQHVLLGQRSLHLHPLLVLGRLLQLAIAGQVEFAQPAQLLVLPALLRKAEDLADVRVVNGDRDKAPPFTDNLSVT
jgi:hypothetical protein